MPQTQIFHSEWNTTLPSSYLPLSSYSKDDDSTGYESKKEQLSTLDLKKLIDHENEKKSKDIEESNL